MFPKDPSYIIPRSPREGTGFDLHCSISTKDNLVIQRCFNKCRVLIYPEELDGFVEAILALKSHIQGR